ncbi:MAG: hypothetical protein CM15mP12_9270 [Gammaproteobacteria bacterium]|nr:MAG: hypothetical protein CM15mP12_9270 [Gammaproteobacteria bacterium]
MLIQRVLCNCRVFPKFGDNLVLDLGIRSTEEDKNVSVASLSAGAAALAAGILDAPRNIYFLAGRDPSLIQRTSDASCQIFLGGCVRDFIDNDSWSSTSPRIGLTYFPDDNTTILDTLQMVIDLVVIT